MSCSGPAAQAPGLRLAEVLTLGLKAAPWRLPSPHWKTLRALQACRTAALGGHRYQCADCGLTHFVPHSCRNRHCPVCQGQAAHRWLEQQQAALLPVPYFHLVFTLPHQLNRLIQQNQRLLYKLLFDAASQTLLEFGRNRLAAQLGITAVLHTWSQTLLDHYHLHCIVTGGGLVEGDSRWVGAPKYYLFPVRDLAKVFCGKFCAGLRELYASDQLEFHGQLAALATLAKFNQLLRQATRKKWVVYAKQPFAGPSQVLAYLSRYTHRVALSPRRLLRLDAANQTVTFAWKDYADGAKSKPMTLEIREFVRRFCLHLLPKRFVKIRHYGLLTNRHRQAKVAQARALLARQNSTQSTSPTLAATQNRPAPTRTCPFCGSDQLRLLELVPPRPTAPSLRFDSS